MSMSLDQIIKKLIASKNEESVLVPPEIIGRDEAFRFASFACFVADRHYGVPSRAIERRVCLLHHQE